MTQCVIEIEIEIEIEIVICGCPVREHPHSFVRN